jgi:hypothetical protein
MKGKLHPCQGASVDRMGVGLEIACVDQLFIAGATCLLSSRRPPRRASSMPAAWEIPSDARCFDLALA